MYRLVLPSATLTIVMTCDTEYRTAVNSGTGESSGFTGDAFVKRVERENVKQLGKRRPNVAVPMHVKKKVVNWII